MATAKEQIKAKDVNEFCSCINSMIRIWQIGSENPNILERGERANELAIEIFGLTPEEDEMPYRPEEWGGIWPLIRKFNQDSTRKDKLSKWKAKALNCTLEKNKIGNPRKQRKYHREGDIALILKKNPDIKLADLAARLNTSPSTISRSKVWKQHRKPPPQKQFLNKISAENS